MPASRSSRSARRGRSRPRSSISPRRSSAPGCAPETGCPTRARWPSSSGSRSRPSARRFACSSSPASSRCGAGSRGGIFVVTDLVPAVAIFTAVKLEEARRRRRPAGSTRAREGRRPRGERAATADDYAELERTVDLLERHLGERVRASCEPMRCSTARSSASCRNETIQTAMRGVARGLAPIRDAQPGGVAFDAKTLDVHRRQLAAMRRRDDGRARGGAGRALPDARGAVREGHRSPLVGALRREGAAAGRLIGARSARHERRDGMRSASNTAWSTSPRSSPSTCSGSGASQRRSTGRRRAAPSSLAAAAPRGPARRRAGEAARGHRRGRDGVEPEVERARGATLSATAPGVGVRIAVRDEDERRPARRRPRAPAGSARGARRRARRRPRERDVARSRPVGRPSQVVDARTSSASKPTPALNPKRRPFTRPRPMPADASRDESRRRDRVAPEAERPWEHAGATRREEAKRDVAGDAVEHLVVRPVTGKDVDRVDSASCSGRAPCLARPRGSDD